MFLEQLASNMAQVELKNGDRVLFSYNTPVAKYVAINGMYFRTSKKWSVTTSKHINKWLDGADCGTVAQDELDNLIRKL